MNNFGEKHDNVSRMKTVKFTIDPSNVGRLIGAGGKNIKRIINENDNVKIDIKNEGEVFLRHNDAALLEKVKEICLGYDIDKNNLVIGEIYKATINKKVPYGFFFKLDEHQYIGGLIHNSQLEGTEKMMLSVNDQINVKYLGINEKKKTAFKLI